MRFDDLLLPVGEYGQGACEHRQEWLLMYSLGGSPARIARWCRVDVRRVRRAVDREIEKNPGWFDGCLLVHDQPAWDGAAARRFARNRGRVWWGHYRHVAAHMGERGGVLPAQNESVRVRELCRWIEAQ